jgi:hypothetical protein
LLVSREVPRELLRIGRAGILAGEGLLLRPHLACAHLRRRIQTPGRKRLLLGLRPVRMHLTRGKLAVVCDLGRVRSELTLISRLLDAICSELLVLDRPVVR